MEISVQASHDETVQPEIGRLHASARAEATDKADVLRKATQAVNTLHEQFKRLHESGTVAEIVVRPISTSSWRPIVKGKQQPPLFRASAQVWADFTDFAALADVAAQFGGVEGVQLDWVEWRLTDETRQRLETLCLARAVDKARDRATVMAQAAGAGEVSFAQLSDPGLLGEPPSVRRAFAAAEAAPMAMMGRAGAKMADDVLSGIELQPEDLTVSVVVQARLTA
ncbi:MAG: SIMPL domain-containing protein [Micropruina sp.]|nr:SIMPL domain-containing protein [Micropruina sp.]